MIVLVRIMIRSVYFKGTLVIVIMCILFFIVLPTNYALTVSLFCIYFFYLLFFPLFALIYRIKVKSKARFIHDVEKEYKKLMQEKN